MCAEGNDCYGSVELAKCGDALYVNELGDFGKTCLTFSALVQKVQVVMMRITRMSQTLPP